MTHAVKVEPMVSFGFELKLTSLNAREHWAKKARRVKRERLATQWAAQAVRRRLHALAASAPQLLVTLERNAPRLLDSDNLAGAFKAVRDEVAALLGRDDSPTAGVEWRYAQAQGPQSFVAVRVEAA